MALESDYGGLTGRINAHVNGFYPNYNRANIIAAAFKMGGRYLMVVNDWELCRDWMALGGIALLRLKGQFNDDDGDAHYDNAAYVNEADRLLNMAEAALPPAWRKRGMIHILNEGGSTEPARQDAWGEAGIKLATRLQRGVVFGNWSIRNPYDDPSTPEWDHFARLPRTIAALQENARLYGGRMGFHEGTDAEAPSASDAITLGKIGAFRKFQNRYGVKVWITEFAGSATARKGWRTLYEGNWARFMQELAYADELVYAWYDTIVSIFTIGVWSEGEDFDYEHEDLELIARINRETYPIKESPVTQPKIVYAPAYICPWLSTKRYRLGGRGNELCQSILRTNGVIDFMKNGQVEEFRIKNGKIQRGKDTSDLWTPDGLQHGEYYILYSDKPATPADRARLYFDDWIDEWVWKGYTFFRRAYVERYKWDGTIIPEKSGWQDTTITVVDVLSSYTFPPNKGGQTLFDVLVLHADGVKENYLYARNFGLVGHDDPTSGSYLTTLSNDSLVIKALTVTNPPPISAPPPAAYPSAPQAAITPSPNPAALGALVERVVERTEALTANVRKEAYASGAQPPVVGTVRAGDVVTVHETPWTGNGYGWYAMTAKNGTPLVGWLSSVATLAPVPAPPEPMIRVVPVPFVSQIGTSAALRQNDCGMADIQSIAAWKLALNNIAMPLLMEVDNLISLSPIASVDAPVGVPGMIKFGALLGLTLVHTIFSERTMMDELDSFRPIILLGNYGHINPAYKKIGHWFILKGYSESQWLINDPYLLGENVRLSKATMVKVQTDLSTYQTDAQGKVINFAGAPYQGFLIR